MQIVGFCLIVAAILTDRRLYSYFVYLPDALSAYQQRLLDVLSSFFLVGGFVLLVSHFLIMRRAAKYSYTDKIVIRCRNCILVLFTLILTLLFTLVILEILFSLLGFTPVFQTKFHKIHQLSKNPDIVYELKPDSRVVIRENRRPTLYKINSQGFRYHKFKPEKKRGLFRILAIGDSVVFGFCIPARERFTDRLEALLNKNRPPSSDVVYEVINAGVGGWNTYNECAFLEARGLQLKPDLILLGFCYNDVNEPSLDFETHTFEKLGNLPSGIFPNPQTAYAHNRWKIRPDSLKLKSVFLTYALRYSSFISWIYRRIEYTLNKDKYKNLRPFDYALSILSNPQTPEWKWLRKQFGKVKKACSPRRIPCVVIIFPVSYQITDPPGVSDKSAKRLKEYLSAEGFYVYDPLPHLKHYAKENLYISKQDYTHFNGFAQNLIASDLYRKLHKWGLLRNSGR